MLSREQLEEIILKSLQDVPRRQDMPFTYEDSMKKYNCIRNGDPQGAIAAASDFRLSCSQAWLNQLSTDALVNSKYLFCMWGTLASRVAVDSGVDMDLAINTLLVFIRFANRCTHVEEICELFKTLFLQYIYEVQQNVAKPLSKTISQAMQYINQHIHENIKAKDVAAYSSRSPRQLNRQFLYELNVTVSQYINRQKLLRAREYLTYSEQSIVEISALLGFSSQSYFTRLFRKAFSVTPRKYREERKTLQPKGTVK